MWPLRAPLEAGIARTPLRELRVGDVIAFIAADSPRLWLHRVVRLTPDGVVTRGDTNAREDPPVPASAVLGRLIALRWRDVVVPVPNAGLSGALWRRGGLLWSALAPLLRQHRPRRRTERKRP